MGANRRRHHLAPFQTWIAPCRAAGPSPQRMARSKPRNLPDSTSVEGGTVTITVENVTKVVRGSEHIRDVSLSFAPGTINILLGPTLSGKTSIMRLLAGLDAPTSGKILVDGADVTGRPVRER